MSLCAGALPGMAAGKKLSPSLESGGHLQAGGTP